MVRLAIAAFTVAVIATGARASELPRLNGMYQPQGQALPMLDSKVEVVVRGPLVEVIVTQRFQNRGEHATEATYIFPLPPDAAVSAMWIKTGTKTIHASIEKREQAQQRYEAAVRAGVTTAVLDQERPDIFTQTVAGIPGKGSVEVVIRYDALAHFYDGAWGMALPMVVAPRYVAGVATSRPTTGTGRAPDTDRAPDASRVTPGGSPGAGGATAVTIQYVDKAWDITSPTHELVVTGQKVAFTDPKSDHDAIIRWKAPTAAGWTESGPNGAFAAVVVEAPAAALQRASTLRCLLVLDRSATARGDADAISQPLVRQFLASLGANDRVAVAGSDTLVWSTAQTIQRSLDQSWQQKAGPFDLTKVLAAARPDGAPIVLVTSGLVADDRAAVAAAKKLGVPVHVIGVGPAPARGLLVQIATATGGTARFATPGDDLPTIAKSVIADAASAAPALTVTWGTLGASDVVPGTLPRLGAGQAVLVLARVTKAQTANARAGGELFAIETLPSPRTVDGATTGTGPLGRRWARSRLEELIATKANAQTITALALKYGLVSPYTSMVAIGDEVVVQGGTRRSVAVPVSVPAGMKWQQVKKETTVDMTSPTGAATDTKKPEEVDGRTRHFADKNDEDKKPKKKTSRKGGDDDDPVNKSEDEGEEEDSPRSAPPSPTDVATISSSGSVAESIGYDSESRVLGRNLRLTTSFAGGFTRSRGESAGLLAIGGRIEAGRGATLIGVDGSALFLRGADVQGRVMLSVARGVARFLEVGIAAGTQFGEGLGAAGSLSVRYHVPPFPRAVVFLRYDAAFLVQEETRRGEHSGTLGLEFGF